MGQRYRYSGVRGRAPPSTCSLGFGPASFATCRLHLRERLTSATAHQACHHTSCARYGRRPSARGQPATATPQYGFPAPG
eukprot:1842211-Pyramimonas_sp.AAC.1